MCRQFHVTTIFYSTEAIRDYPKGTVWAKDKEGEWYYYEGYKRNSPAVIDEILVTTDRRQWGKIPYRDFWRHSEVKRSGGAPFYDDIRNGKYITIL